MAPIARSLPLAEADKTHYIGGEGHGYAGYPLYDGVLLLPPHFPRKSPMKTAAKSKISDGPRETGAENH
jgi:hypothetical protein